VPPPPERILWIRPQQERAEVNYEIRPTAYICQKEWGKRQRNESMRTRAEELSEGAGADRVHGSRLQVHQDRAGHVATARRLVKQGRKIRIFPLLLSMSVTDSRH
jgi:hypothetical protein